MEIPPPTTTKFEHGYCAETDFLGKAACNENRAIDVLVQLLRVFLHLAITVVGFVCILGKP